MIFQHAVLFKLRPEAAATGNNNNYNNSNNNNMANSTVEKVVTDKNTIVQVGVFTSWATIYPTNSLTP